MPEENKIITLLEENNGYLKELLHLQKNEHRSRLIAQIINFLATILPFVLILIIGYFAWQAINHYLEILNNNINTLKTNFDALRDFFQKLIPDFSSISSKLNETWQTVQFWNK